jgi:hypothetical protein
VWFRTHDSRGRLASARIHKIPLLSGKKA